jgi:hypothetical protein
MARLIITQKVRVLLLNLRSPIPKKGISLLYSILLYKYNIVF